MAIKTIIRAPTWSIDLVLDTVAKTVTGINIDASGSAYDVKCGAVVLGVTQEVVTPAGTTSNISFGAGVPYLEPSAENIGKRGFPEFSVPSIVHFWAGGV